MISYLRNVFNKGSFSIFTLKTGSDTDVDNYYKQLFANGQQKEFFNKRVVINDDSDARVIDEYNLFSNNCTTTSFQSLQPIAPSIFSHKIIRPKKADSYLSEAEVNQPEIIEHINDPVL